MTKDDVKALKAKTTSRAVRRQIETLAAAERYAVKYFAKLDALTGEKRLAESYRDLYRAGLADLKGGQTAELERIIGNPAEMFPAVARLSAKQ